MNPSRSPREIPPTRFRNNRVEIFVGVAALAVLVAILAPVVRSYRRTENLVSCTDNLRQISQGLRAYAVDYDDHLPLAPSWQVSLRAANAFPRYSGCTQAPETSWGYAMDERLSGRALATLTIAGSDRVLLYDSSKPGPNAHDSGTSFHAPHPNPKEEGNALCGSVSFVDGHAYSYTQDKGTAITKQGSR